MSSVLPGATMVSRRTFSRTRAVFSSSFWSSASTSTCQEFAEIDARHHCTHLLHRLQKVPTDGVVSVSTAHPTSAVTPDARQSSLCWQASRPCGPELVRFVSVGANERRFRPLAGRQSRDPGRPAMLPPGPLPHSWPR